MKSEAFREILSALSELSPKQRQALKRVLLEEMPREAEAADPEACAHCGSEEFIGWGRTAGRQRWKCHSCGRTFGRLTNTVAHGLAYEEVWPEFIQALMDGAVLREIAERCGIHITTAHRWRTRFLQNLVDEQPKLQGIAEADETYLRRSAKGQPKEREKLGRPPRHRGGGRGGAGGRSLEQIPVFLAQDRSGAVVGRVVDRFDRDVAATLLRQAVASDAILCTDGHKAYMGAARELGLQHERLIPTKGGRVRGPFHVQNVNNLQSRFKDWLRRFRGVSTARLPLYVAWFNRITQPPPDRKRPNQMLQHILATAPTA